MAAANLTRTQLELGGKNALIVMDDADVDAADRGRRHGRLLERGAVVHVDQPSPAASGDRARRSSISWSRAARQMAVGDGLQETTDMGPSPDRSSMRT